MIVIATGSRTWKDGMPVRDGLILATRLCGDGWTPRQITLFVGDANGADAIAHTYAKAMDWDVRFYVAHWERYGNAAGPMRNDRMRAEALMMARETHRPIVAVAFLIPSLPCRGTRQMMEGLFADSIRTLVVPG